MKRKLLIFALVLAAALLFAAAATAETDPIVCSMEVSPSGLSAPGPVNVTITVSNSGDTDMKDPLMLYNPVSELVEDFGTNGAVILKAGEVKTWSGTWDVNQRTLENGSVVFFVKYTLYKDSGEAYAQSQPIRGKLSMQAAAAEIEIKRTITPGTARAGQSVTVKYDIINTGTVSLTNITIKENKDINKDAQTIKELKPGETAQIKFPVTMGKKDLTSSATITYQTADSKKKQTQEVEAQKIVYGEPAMSAKLTASAKGVPVGETVKLTLELKNGGSVDYSDLRVTDPTLGEVFTNQELAKDGTLNLEKEITLTETTEYQFTITAIDNTGTEVSLASDPVSVTAVDPDKVLHLTLTAASDKTEVYDNPGTVRFSLTVLNDSEVDAKEVVISHGDTSLYTFASIPAGESRAMTRDAALSMGGTYQFTAKATNELGDELSFQSNGIQIAFSVPTPAPATATPPPIPTAEPTFQPITPVPINDASVGAVPKLIRSVFYPVMLVGIVLLIGSLALLAVAYTKRAKQKKESDAAFDHLERVKRRDYIAPNDEEPVKPEPESKPEEEALPDDLADDVELPHMQYVREAYEKHREDTAAYGYDDETAYPDDAMVGDGTYGDLIDEQPQQGAYEAEAQPGTPYDESMFRRPSDLPNGQPLDDGYAQDAEQSAYDTDYADPADPYAGYDAPAETYTGDYDEDAAHAGDSACEDAPAEDAQQPDDEASASRRRTHRRAGGNPTSY